MFYKVIQFKLNVVFISSHPCLPNNNHLAPTLCVRLSEGMGKSEKLLHLLFKILNSNGNSCVIPLTKNGFRKSIDAKFNGSHNEMDERFSMRWIVHSLDLLLFVYDLKNVDIQLEKLCASQLYM